MVIVWAGIAFEEELVEPWYVWKLDSAEEEDQELAAEKLGQMKSRRAIPRLVEVLRHSPKIVEVRPLFFVDEARWGKGLFRDVRSHYSFKALVRIGRPAVPALVRLLNSTDENDRWAAAAALREIDPREQAWRFAGRRDGEPPFVIVVPDQPFKVVGNHFGEFLEKYLDRSSDLDP